MSGLAPHLNKVLSGLALTEEESEAAVITIMEGHASPVHIAAFLVALKVRGETTDELTGAARAMRRMVTAVPHEHECVVDTCGTGGDGAKTFNISTAAAFVVAAAELKVAKHGNRAVSSSVGSADVLEALGASLTLSAEAVGRCLDEVGIGFMFAPHHHGALKHAAPVRRELGVRTMFNLLGPMTNPASATHQLMGIFDGARLMQVAEVLGRLGVKRALVVHGPHGLDELGLDGTTDAVLLEGGTVRSLTLDPQGLVEPAPVSALAGGDAAHNALLVRQALAGEPGPHLEVVALNAGAALWVAEAATDLADGVRLARDVIRRGLARERLEAWVALTSKLGEQ
jgi:anthranilate phosphoribosyltransferase